MAHSPRRRKHGQVVGHPIEPEDVRAMLAEGFHPAETWVAARGDTLKYYLQARWYMENQGVIDGERRGDPARLPEFRPSRRPELANPAGLLSGRSDARYAALYRHPDGLPPAQAEVWIDIDGDGRFNPGPARGERFRMQGAGEDYRAGVVYTTTARAGCAYVFRFADANWNPPIRGGLVPGRPKEYPTPTGRPNSAGVFGRSV